MKLFVAMALGLLWLSSGYVAAETMSVETVEQSEGRRQEAAININEATVEMLTSLPRIGETVAGRIVEFRQEHGPFKRIEELMNVRGVGEKTFSRLKDRITVGATRKSGQESSGR